MQCDICGKKKATVHLTEIVDDQMSEMHLCEVCAKEKSSQVEQQFGLADLLAGLSDFGKQVKTQETETLRCPNCSLTYDDFRKFGRLGCSECYDAFKKHLSTLLKKIHGANHHLGKTPLRIPLNEKKLIEQLQELKNQLQMAIQVEDFELAAKLRDEIRAEENKGMEKK
ncbi:Nucleotide excision repair protein, with UvrB/UvrC motif [hydrothermal vent metagenome]|uniref:Nucleotide excision repair protein, with UvrB/UvrC motif n=1 Tax=hydrothermal vent metagenome TaxID=652676 RepID=A0A3B0TLK7_9ZZZZ